MTSWKRWSCLEMMETEDLTIDISAEVGATPPFTSPESTVMLITRAHGTIIWRRNAMVSDLTSISLIKTDPHSFKSISDWFSSPGSASCPQRGCYDCPTYSPGENPFFKERHKQSELIRAKDFMESGEADKFRKVVELLIPKPRRTYCHVSWEMSP